MDTSEENLVSAYLCLGSNAPNAPEFLRRARWHLNQLEYGRAHAQSSIYLTEPQNYRCQPWFHNQVIRLDVVAKIPPDRLMRDALAIEALLGRTRTGPAFGPRVIDIDILLFGELASDDPFCRLPHPRLAERAFALVPLAELAPEIKIGGKSAQDWLAMLNWRREGNKIFQ